MWTCVRSWSTQPTARALGRGSCPRAPGLGLRTVVLLEGRGEGINRGLRPAGSVPGAQCLGLDGGGRRALRLAGDRPASLFLL